MEKKQSTKKQLKGKVVSRYIQHPKYKKFYTVDKKHKAHDEKGEYKVGDTVIIEETRPISKDKHFVVISKV